MPNITITGRRLVLDTARPVQLVDVPQLAKFLRVTALETNTSYVFLGDKSILAAAGSQSGIWLRALHYQDFTDIDMSTLWVDARVDGEGVMYWGY